MSTLPLRLLPPLSRSGPAGRLLLSAALMAPALIGLSVALAGAAAVPVLMLPLALFGTVAAVAAQALPAAHPHAALGPANLVTLLRGALAAALVAPLVAPGPAASAPLSWSVVVVAAGALLLDGVDGWLARRRRTASVFGARFDMEVDAVLALVLALLVWNAGKAGAWVLVLGLARYAFVLASLALPWLAAPLRPSLRRKAVCVLQIGTLVALLAPVVLPPVSTALALSATVALAWSFGKDILWLRRHRP